MLYLIATPIGNLKDISLRAIEALEQVEVILCEDTRNTGLFLDNMCIKNDPKLVSFYDENEEQRIPEIMNLLAEGKKIALISDAGTPLISDPGYRLVKKCRKIGIEVTSLPGANAAINALVLSGMPTGRFCFLGFLPKKDGERKKVLEKYKEIEGSKIIYESPFRVEKLLSEIKEVFGEDAEVAISREMTKKFEETLVGSVIELQKKLPSKIKGEITVVIA